MFLLFVLVICAAVSLLETVLVRLVSKRVKGPTVPWRTAVYWSGVVVLVSGFVSSISRSPNISDIGALLISIVGWASLHVGLGGFFLADQVRGPDLTRQPWRWGAKVTGIAGALLVVGIIVFASIFWIAQGAIS
jgi:hypothetical protein